MQAKGNDTKNTHITSSNLSHLFHSIQTSPQAVIILQSLLHKESPIAILLEGCSFTENINELSRLIAPRHNALDRVYVIDINPIIIDKFHSYILQHPELSQIYLQVADIHNLPYENNSFDVVINNFTMNYSQSTRDDARTLSEIHRVMHTRDSICVLSIGVTMPSHPLSYSTNHEYVVETATVMHPLSHYLSLFVSEGFIAVEFEHEKNQSINSSAAQFPYHRFMLTPYENAH
jgi:hypothetical protein